MKKRYSEEQIIKAAGISRKPGISIGPFYNWRSKYAGLEVNEANRLRELETEIIHSKNFWQKECWKSKQ